MSHALPARMSSTPPAWRWRRAEKLRSLPACVGGTLRGFWEGRSRVVSPMGLRPTPGGVRFPGPRVCKLLAGVANVVPTTHLRLLRGSRALHAATLVMLLRTSEGKSPRLVGHRLAPPPFPGGAHPGAPGGSEVKKAISKVCPANSLLVVALGVSGLPGDCRAWRWFPGRIARPGGPHPINKKKQQHFNVNCWKPFFVM